MGEGDDEYRPIRDAELLDVRLIGVVGEVGEVDAVLRPPQRLFHRYVRGKLDENRGDVLPTLAGKLGETVDTLEFILNRLGDERFDIRGRNTDVGRRDEDIGLLDLRRRLSGQRDVGDYPEDDDQKGE